MVEDLVPGAFSVDDLGPYPGFLSMSRGLLFSLEAAVAIARDYCRLPSEEGEPLRQALYDAASDTFRFLDPATLEWLEWRGIEVGAIKLYPIGTPQWTWLPEPAVAGGR